MGTGKIYVAEKKLQTNSKSKILYIILGFLLLERILLCLFLPPIIEPDTLSYKKPAVVLLENGNFEGMKYRTPGYTLFLASVYSMIKSDTAVVFIQHILGLIVIFLILKMLPAENLKIIVAFLFLIDVQVVRYEHSIIADFLLAFMFTGYIYFKSVFFQTRKTKFLFFSSLFLAYAFITKPVLKLFPYVSVVVLVLFLIKKESGFKDIAGKVFIFICPVLILWVGWSMRNYKQFGHFGLTVSSGVQLTVACEDFIDFFSPLHYEIKQAYKRRLDMGKLPRSSVINYVIKDVEKDYKGSEVNKKLAEIAKEAIFKHPDKYVLRGIKETFFFYFSNDSILTVFFDKMRYGSMLDAFRKGGVSGFTIAKFFLNFYIFWWFVLAGFGVFVGSKIKGIKKTGILETLILLSIFYINGVSVFADFGIPRYRMPIQPLMILCSAYGWYKMCIFLKSHSCGVKFKGK